MRLMRVMYAGIAVACIAGVAWVYNTSDFINDSHIVTYRPERDRADVLDIFYENWGWLVAPGVENYSPELRIDKKATSPLPRDMNKLTIDVYRMDNQTVGFVAYFQNNFYKGSILFLAVRSSYRGRGIARALLAHAVEQLRKKGLHVVQLYTRLDNAPARHIYESFGFKHVESDSPVMTYRYQIPRY